MTPRQHYDVYIADCAAEGGVHVYDFYDGKLTEKQFLALDRPMYLAIDNNRLYAILQKPFPDNPLSGILSVGMDGDGLLGDPSAIISTDGTVCCHLSVKNGTVYDANYLSGSVNQLGVKTVRHTGKGPNPARQEAPHVHYTQFSPDGKYILVCDLGLDTIFVYDEALQKISSARVPDGHGVRHLAYDGNTVYSANELASSISVFSYTAGQLTYEQTVPGLPAGFDGPNTAAAIRVDGNRLYVSQRGLDAICVFDITRRIPEYLTCFATGGHSPRDFAVVGDHIIVTNEGGNVTVFDKKDYTRCDEIRLISPLCVISREK